MGNRYATEWSDPPPDEVELVVLRGAVVDPLCHLSRGDTDPAVWAVIIDVLSDEMNDQYNHWRPSQYAASERPDSRRGVNAGPTHTSEGDGGGHPTEAPAPLPHSPHMSFDEWRRSSPNAASGAVIEGSDG